MPSPESRPALAGAADQPYTTRINAKSRVPNLISGPPCDPPNDAPAQGLNCVVNDISVAMHTVALADARAFASPSGRSVRTRPGRTSKARELARSRSG